MKRHIALCIAAALGLAVAGACGASEVRTESSVRALLFDQGYSNVTNLGLRGGAWLAEARDSEGRPVTIKVDPGTARVFATSRKVTIVRTPAPVHTREVVREVPVERTVVREVPVERTVVREVPVERTVVREVPVERRVAVVPRGPLTAEGARAVLHDAGYHNVHDLSMRNGKWVAEARDATGDDREIHLDAMTGAIVHVEDD
ncbi:MAG TPA: PepSY domain-containing protein [Candidatus Saccharimonadia bacterium]|nr:PepSY domain-containing protein [Candidatus Saccharimonadia bacterium]